MHTYLWILWMIEVKEGSKESFCQEICMRIKLEVSDMHDVSIEICSSL